MATNFVLRTVYLTPEMDSLLRAASIQENRSKNDIIRDYVEAGMRKKGVKLGADSPEKMDANKLRITSAQVPAKLAQTKNLSGGKRTEKKLVVKKVALKSVKAGAKKVAVKRILAKKSAVKKTRSPQSLSSTEKLPHPSHFQAGGKSRSQSRPVTAHKAQ